MILLDVKYLSLMVRIDTRVYLRATLNTHLYLEPWPLPVYCGDMGHDPGDVTGMEWERAGEEPPNDGVTNWWLVAGDSTGRPREPAGDGAKLWGAAGEGCRRAESWAAVVQKQRDVCASHRRTWPHLKRRRFVLTESNLSLVLSLTVVLEAPLLTDSNHPVSFRKILFSQFVFLFVCLSFSQGFVF